MSTPNHVSERKCTCDSGSYCRVHLRYNTPDRVYSGAALKKTNANQRCGGGQRILRKTTGD